MRRRNSFIWLIAVLFMTAVVVFVFTQQSKSYNWGEKLNTEGDDPYDIEIFLELLKSNNQGKDFQILDKKFNAEWEDLDHNKRYILYCIKRNFFPDSAELKALVEFVNEGNTVFVASNNISPLLPIAFAHGTDSVSTLLNHTTTEEIYNSEPDSILKKYELVDTWTEKDSIHKQYQRQIIEQVWNDGFLDSSSFSYRSKLFLNESSTELSVNHRYRNDSLERNWQSVKIPPQEISKEIIHFANTNSACVDWKLGNGHVIVTSVPLIFTNYMLAQKEGFKFCNDLVSQFPSGDILVDDVNRFNKDLFTPKSRLSKSPLSFILSQPALMWAWYLLILGALIFVLFKSKRKQRVIPILKPNLNTTLAYAKMLGSLQLKEKDNTGKGQEIIRHLFQHLSSNNRWRGNEINEQLKDVLLKLAPEKDREIQIVLHLGSKALKSSILSDQELIKLFNCTQELIEKT